MPSAGFEPIISEGERLQTYALDRAASGTGRGLYYMNIKHKKKTFKYYSLGTSNVVNSIEIYYRLNFKRRIKSHLPFAGIIRSSLYSPRFQDKG